MMLRAFRRAFLTIALLNLSTAEAQTTVYDSGGFETFNTGTVGNFYINGFGNPSFTGQQGWLTTDQNQSAFFFGTPAPAGTVGTSPTNGGARSFSINGNNLVADPTFSDTTFWYQRVGNGTAAQAFNPIANNLPIVRVQWDQRVDYGGAATDMGAAGFFMEGFTQSGTQQVVNTVFVNPAFGLTVFTSDAIPNAGVSTPNNSIANNTWISFQADFDFVAQAVRLFSNGTPLFNGLAIPFRNSNGPTVSITEFGFIGALNTVSGINTTGISTFDNFRVTAVAVPEPSTYVSILGVGLATLAVTRRRRRAA